MAPGTNKTIGNHTFTNWGSHYNDYPCAYLTAAAAIGMNSEEIDTFCKRLDKTLTKFKKNVSKKVLGKYKFDMKELNYINFVYTCIF